MKVLWFANSPSLYRSQNKGYNGCGWISSLEEKVIEVPNIQLAVCILHPEKRFKEQVGEVTYYPISLYNSKIKKIIHNIFYSKFDKIELKQYLKVIDDFKPDIIHIFGSEHSFGLITQHTDIPVVIHLQGILNPCLNAWFPPGTSAVDYFKHLSIRKAINKIKALSFIRTSAKREMSIIKNSNFFMGRTEWDKAIVNLYSPTATYYYSSEILRAQFYSARHWTKVKRVTYQIMSTISQADYKGFDLILKTAAILKEHTDFEFTWKVYGISEYKFWERKLNINATEVNVELMGVVSPETLVEAILESDIFVHPSYIDNSPNSICEAQYLGMPVISTNVGGIASLIKDNETGFLVPSNDPFTLASKTISVMKDEDLLQEIGRRARDTAKRRHDKDLILQQNLQAYQDAIETKKLHDLPKIAFQI